MDIDNARYQSVGVTWGTLNHSDSIRNRFPERIDADKFDDTSFGEGLVSTVVHVGEVYIDSTVLLEEKRKGKKRREEDGTWN
jgi:hypothetical protein